MLCFAKLMHRLRVPSKWFFRLCCAGLFFITAAASVTGYYERWPFWTSGIAEGTTQPYEVSLLEGTLRRPYIYRHLLPDIANFAAKITPGPTQDSLYELIFPSDKSRGPAKLSVLAGTSIPAKTAWFPFFILYLLPFASALLAVAGMCLICQSFEMPVPVCVITPVVTILLAPYFYVYPYDYSELAFLTLAAWVALRFDWWWVLPVAVLGTWNKESFLFFMPALYPFVRQRATARAAAAGVTILTFTCGVVYLCMRARFAQAAGTPVEFALSDRISSFFSPFLLFTSTDEVYGLRFVRVSTLVPTLLLVWAFVRVWRRFPMPLCGHVIIAAAINFPLYAMFCSPNEYRNLSMLTIAFLLTIAFNFREWLERSMSPIGVSTSGD